jgi:hypothetical protein
MAISYKAGENHLYYWQTGEIFAFTYEKQISVGWQESFIQSHNIRKIKEVEVFIFFLLFCFVI